MSGFLTSPLEVSRLPVIRGEFPLQQVLLHLSTQTREVLDLTSWEPMCTDETIARICACNKNVKSFTLQNSNSLTASGLQLLLRYQRRLRTLDLSNATKISFPARFDFTCGITHLDLSHSVISDSDLGHLRSCCPHLTTLKLVKCSGVSSVGVRHLVKKEGETARLNSLDLTDCSAVDDAGVVALVTRLKHMVDLRLSGLGLVTEKTLTAIINNCQSLQVLRIDRCPSIKAECVQLLVSRTVIWGERETKGMPSLTDLDVSRNQWLTGIALRYFCSGCVNLRSINCSYCPHIDNNGLHSVTVLRNLTSVNFSHCASITDTGAKLFKTMEFAGEEGEITLTNLGFGGCHALTDEGLHAMAEPFDGLEHLDMSELDRVEEIGLLAFVELNAETLLSLDLHGCSKLNSRALLLTLRECENLTELNLSGVPAADEESLQPLPNLSKLHTLSLSNCTGIRDEMMDLMPDLQLRKLDLSHNKQLTHVGIQRCLSQCDQLEEINLTRCGNVQISEVLQFIKERITMMGTSNLFIDSRKAKFLLQRGGRKYFVFKLRTINLYGCKGISRATERALWGKLKGLESSLSEYVVKAYVNPKPPNPFFGLRLFSDAIHVRARDKAYKFYEVTHRSAVRMQCMFRARQSRILHRKLKFAYDTAVLKQTRALQRLFRGYMGRQRWKQEKRRQQIERLMRRAGAKKMQAAFRAYRVRRNFLFFAQSLLRVWRLWTKTQHKVRNHCRWLLLMRRKFRPLWKKHAIKAERVAWAGFRESIAMSKRRKQQLVAIFLNSVALKTHNSIRQLRQRAKSRKMEMRIICRNTAFPAFREILQMRRNNLRRALMFWRMSSKRRFWNNWRVWLTQYKALKALLATKAGRADHHFQMTTKRKSFKKLKKYLAKRRVKRAKLKKALTFWRHRSTLSGLNQWKYFCRLQKIGRVALQRWITRSVTYGFKALRAGVEYQKRQRYNMVVAVRHMIHFNKRRVFRGFWRWLNRGRILPLLMFRLKRERVLAKWWVQWERATEWLAQMEANDMEAYRRQMELRKELMLSIKRKRFEGAVLFQSIWRGFSDRRFASYRRDFLVRHVIRIQTLCRRRLGTLAVYRAKRMKRLLGFIKREADCDQMLLEDERSHQHRTFYKHLVNIQRMYRGRLGQIKAFKRLQEVVRAKALKERERNRKAREEAKERKLKREEEEALRNYCATRIQSLWRQKKAYEAFLHTLYLVHQIKYSIKLQAFYRGRLARKRAAGIKRTRWINQKMRRRRAFTGKFFRFFRIKKRDKQNEARRFMTQRGIYPGSFCLTGDTLKTELKEDWVEFKYHMRAFFHHIRSINHKSHWINANKLGNDVDQLPLMMDPWQPKVSKFDAVQLLKADHVRSGETGFVLNFEGDGSYGTKAVVKMDKDGEIILIPNYHRVYKLGIKPSLRKIERRSTRTFTPAEIEANKINLIQRAQELSIWYRDYRAARMLQRVVRMRRSRKRVQTVRRLYHFALDAKRMKIYRFLRRLHIAYADTGRTLVKFRIFKPESIPEMPENDNFDVKKYNKKIQKQLNEEIQEMFAKQRSNLMNDIARGVLTKDDVLRWRVRNTRNLLWGSIKNFCNKHLWFKMAEKLMLDAEKTDLSDPDATESRFLKFVARVFGGADFFHDRNDRRAWVGLHTFKDMSRSPHVVQNKWFPVMGMAIVHGVWVDDVPHGEGTIWFPTGTNLSGDVYAKPIDWEQQLRDRTGDTGGRRGEKKRRWKQYEEIYCKNIEKGALTGKKVVVTFRNGERYEGPFVPYGRQPTPEHRGVWHKTNGWEYRGNCVTNHFDSTRITGYFTVKTSKNSTYDGYVHMNKRHGYGRMRFANGDEYNGEWRLGLKHGFGTFKDTKGNVYTGDWVNDKMHGVGMDTRADGRVYKGTIVDGKWHKKGVLRVPSKRFPGIGTGMDEYTADFQFGYVHGEGELLFANGDRYVGPFEKNKRQGKGVCHFITKERYEGPYHNDEMHGVGHWIKPRGSAHDEIRIGLWKEGFHRRWLGYAVSKLITNEFIRRFKDEGGVDGPFAEFVVEKIPDLPQGVDKADEKVQEIVAKIMRRQGPDASRLMMQKTQTEYTKHSKFCEAGNVERNNAHARLRDTTMELNKQRRVVLEQKRLLQELKADKIRLERQLEDFWVRDDYENRKKFLRTIRPLQVLSRQDWYRLRSVPDLNEALKALLVTGVCSLFGLPKKWSEVKLLCGDSDQNRIANDREAFLYTYDNKFVFLSKKFDPFIVAQDEELCAALEKVFYLPNVRPSNPDIFGQALAAARICAWFRRATCLVRKAKSALDIWQELQKVTTQLETEIDINHEELDLLRQLENRIEEDQRAVEVVDQVYEKLQEQQMYLTNLIETIEQNAVDLTKFQIMDSLEIEDLGAAIERGELDIDAIFLKASTHEIRAIKSFIQAGFPVETKDKHGNTLLHVACEQVDIEMAKMLVEYGHCNLNAVNDIGNTPLHYALMYGADTPLGPWLIKKGADDTIVNKTGNTVYDGIGKDERRAFEEMKKLEDEMEAKRSEETGLGSELGQFPFADSDEEEDEKTPLLQSSKKAAMVPKPPGPPPKLMNTKIEDTIAHAFASCAEADAPTVLGYIDNVYNTFGVKVKDEGGNTALLATAKGIRGDNIYKYQGLISSLLLRGADINHQNNDGNTALHFAFANDKSGNVGRFLIEKGARDQISNNLGLSPYDGLDFESAFSGGGDDQNW